MPRKQNHTFTITPEYYTYALNELENHGITDFRATYYHPQNAYHLEIWYKEREKDAVISSIESVLLEMIWDLPSAENH